MYDGDPAADALRRAISNTAARWPASTDSPNRLVPEAWPTLVPRFTLNRSDVVFTIGSCFARNIERYLDQFGMTVPMLDFKLPEGELVDARPQAIMNKYTPPSIYQELKRTADLLDASVEERKAKYADVLMEINKGFIDLELGGRDPVSLERALERREDVFQVFRHAFTADVVVITLGLIECWWDCERNRYVHPLPPPREISRQKGRFLFKQLRFAEAYDYASKAIELVSSKGKPGVRILITTSPVPLNTTFTAEDVLMANMYSKSMLRTVAGELYRNFPNIDYFPSFESVMLSRTDSVWNPDLVHVTDGFVGKIVDRLLAAYLPGTATEHEQFDRAVALIKMGEYQQAASVLDALKMDDPRTQTLRALAHLHCGDETALAQLRKSAIEADLPGTEYALVSRQLLKSKAFRESATVLQRAVDAGIEGQAEKIDALLRLTRLRRALKDADGAATALAEAKRIAPRRLTVLRELANNAEVMGNSKMALHYLDQIMKNQRFQTMRPAMKAKLQERRLKHTQSLEPARLTP